MFTVHMNIVICLSEKGKFFFGPRHRMVCLKYKVWSFFLFFWFYRIRYIWIVCIIFKYNFQNQLNQGMDGEFGMFSFRMRWFFFCWFVRVKISEVNGERRTDETKSILMRMWKDINFTWLLSPGGQSWTRICFSLTQKILKSNENLFSAVVDFIFAFFRLQYFIGVF